MPKISIRGEKIPASPIRKLTPFSDAAKAKGVKVYHLTSGSRIFLRLKKRWIH